MARYTMRLRSVGNPDFRQYTSISIPETFEADTLPEMRVGLEAYLAKWNLGGGNLPTVVVREGKKTVGYFSYNGRFWNQNPGRHFETAQEILI